MNTSHGFNADPEFNDPKARGAARWSTSPMFGAAFFVAIVIALIIRSCSSSGSGKSADDIPPMLTPPPVTIDYENGGWDMTLPEQRPAGNSQLSLAEVGAPTDITHPNSDALIWHEVRETGMTACIVYSDVLSMEVILAGPPFADVITDENDQSKVVLTAEFFVLSSNGVQVEGEPQLYFDDALALGLINDPVTGNWSPSETFAGPCNT